MKSKLFLSLSLLTAIFSVNADLSHMHLPAYKKAAEAAAAEAAYQAAQAAAKEALEMGQVEQAEAKAARAASDTSKVIREASKNILKKAAFYSNVGKAVLFGSALGYAGHQYLAQEAQIAQEAQVAKEAEAAKEAELANRAWYTKAYESAKGGIVYGCEKVQTACVNVYNVAKDYTFEKPYHVATGAAAAAVLAYGAYSLYYGEVATN